MVGQLTDKSQNFRLSVLLALDRFPGEPTLRRTKNARVVLETYNAKDMLQSILAQYLDQLDK